MNSVLENNASSKENSNLVNKKIALINKALLVIDIKDSNAQKKCA